MNELREQSIKARRIIEESGYSGKTSILRKSINRICSLPFWKYVFKTTCENVTVTSSFFEFENLPRSFDGYKILFLSDLHLEIKPNPLKKLLDMELPEHDIVIFGGDFFDAYDNRDLNALSELIGKFDKRKLAILGNHDKEGLIEFLESLNVEVLINESLYLSKGKERILLTGVDDITQYRSQEDLQIEACLSDKLPCSVFKIMLSHNPDFLEDAESTDYDLQLSGHTHGGQFKIFNYIVFPQTKYDFAIAGKWKFKNIQGFTSTGFGSSGYPIRNILPEIGLIELKRIER